MVVRDVGIIVGQDLWAVRNYSAVFPDVPAGVMSYASLASVPVGLSLATNYGSGVEWAQALVAPYPESTALQLGLYLKDQLPNITRGDMDRRIEDLAKQILDLAPRKVLLRIGYEFDSPLNQYIPEDYKAAFRRIQSHLPKNAKTVWHSWAFQPWEADGGAGVAAWWCASESYERPGTDVVDWCGVSIFQQAYGNRPETAYGGGGDLSHAELLADFCANFDKPLMIAESTPFGLGYDESHKTIWTRWFDPVLDFIERRDVKLWSYINCDWDAEAQWAGGGWGDSRLEAEANLRTRWSSRVLHGGEGDPLRVETAAGDHTTRTLVWRALGLPALGVLFVVLAVSPWRRIAVDFADGLNHDNHHGFGADTTRYDSLGRLRSVDQAPGSNTGDDDSSNSGSDHAPEPKHHQQHRHHHHHHHHHRGYDDANRHDLDIIGPDRPTGFFFDPDQPSEIGPSSSPFSKNSVV